MEDVANCIRNLCAQRNITVHGLAKLSGIPYSTLREIVSDPDREPQLGTIQQICTTLNISLAEFFSEPLAPDLPPAAQAELKSYEEYLRYKYLGK